MKKSNLHRHFKEHKTSIDTGIWFEIDDKTAFLVKPFSDHNEALKPVMTKHYKPFAKQVDMGTLSSQKEREIMVTVFCEACLVDWKGVEIDDKETPFSKEAAKALLLELPDLYTTLQAYAMDQKNYREIIDPEDLGNS